MERQHFGNQPVLHVDGDHGCDYGLRSCGCRCIAPPTCSSKFVQLLRGLADQHEHELDQVGQSQIYACSWVEQELAAHCEALAGDLEPSIRADLHQRHSNLCAGLTSRLSKRPPATRIADEAREKPLQHAQDSQRPPTTGCLGEIVDAACVSFSSPIHDRATGGGSPERTAARATPKPPQLAKGLKAKLPPHTVVNEVDGNPSEHGRLTEGASDVDPSRSQSIISENGMRRRLEQKNSTLSVKSKRSNQQQQKWLASISRQWTPSEDEELQEMNVFRRWQNKLRDIVGGDTFEVALALVITLNTVLMGVEMQYHGGLDGLKLGFDGPQEDSSAEVFFEVCEWIFGCIFTMEAFLKLIAMDGTYFIEPNDPEDVPLGAPEPQEGVPTVIEIIGPRSMSWWTGKYELCFMKLENELPIWKKIDGHPLWIYSGQDKKWYVGEKEEVTFEGMVSASEHDGRMPHELDDGWIVVPSNFVCPSLQVSRYTESFPLCRKCCFRLFDIFSRIDYWNILDLCIVLFWFINIASDAQLPIDPMLLRLVRLARLLRLLRLVRTIQGFDSLYLMTTTIKGSFAALFWSVLLMFVVQTMIAFILHQLLQAYYTDESNPLDQRKLVYKYFGTFSKAMFTMFELTLANWIPVSRLLVEEVSEIFMFFVLTYKLVIGFSVIMVITGVFNQQTFKVAATDDHIMLTQKEREIRIHKQKMQNLFSVADMDGDGHIEKEEFIRICKIPAMKKWLGCVGVPVDDAEKVFDLMVGDSHVLDADRLATCMSRLKGTASSVDLALAHNETQRLLRRIIKRLDARNGTYDKSDSLE